MLLQQPTKKYGRYVLGALLLFLAFKNPEQAAHFTKQAFDVLGQVGDAASRYVDALS